MVYNIYPAVNETYQFPPEVRGALAVSIELRNTVIPMTEVLRNNLTAPELWDGRLIVNTTSDRVNRWDSGTSQWHELANLTDISALILAAMPIGAITMYAGTTAPTGWHLCDGTAHGSAVLEALSGSPNTFNLRDKFIIAAGSTYARGATGGAARVTLSAAESGVPAHGHGTATSGNNSVGHTHSIPALSGSTNDPGDHQHDIARSTAVGTGATTAQGTGSFTASLASSLDGAHTHTVTTVANTTGAVSASHTHQVTVANNTATAASASHENLPPYYALTYIVKKA